MEKKAHEIWHSRFLNQVIDSMAEGMFTLNNEGQISSWNQAMEHITGYGVEEALGQPCGFLNFNRCFGKVCPAHISDCGLFKHGGTEIKECFLRHKNGRDVPVIKNARVVRDEDGATIGAVETVTDLTELNEARIKAELFQISEKVRHAPDVRMDRVEEIKKKLEDPNYIDEVVVEHVAEQIMDMFGV